MRVLGLSSGLRLEALGGEWSVQLFKKLTTDVGSYAKDKSIAKSCEKTKFPERKSFAVNRYGMANSRMLAEEVVRRGGGSFGLGSMQAHRSRITSIYWLLLIGQRQSMSSGLTIYRWTHGVPRQALPSGTLSRCRLWTSFDALGISIQ